MNNAHVHAYLRGRAVGDPEGVMDILQAAIASGVIMLVMDAVWLGLVVKGFIAERVGHLLREKPLKAPAVVFYTLYALALAVFAITPAMPTGDWVRAGLTGGFLGLVAYGTYDLTNLSLIEEWPLSLTVTDMAWGTFMSAAASAAAVALIGLFT